MQARNDGQTKALRSKLHLLQAHRSIARGLLLLCAMLALVLPFGMPAALAGPTQAGAPAAGTALAGSGGTDSLYVGDAFDNTVKRFDATTGAYQGTFVKADDNGGLHGPRGIIYKGGNLYVVNQNAQTPFNGDLLQFSGKTGAYLKTFFPSDAVNCDPVAPWNPRAVIGAPNQTLYVSDLGEPGDPTCPGKILQIDMQTGALIARFDPSGFAPEFRPRGMVTGPDGMLYVAGVGNLNAGDVFTGYVLRFDPHTRKFVDVVIANPATSPAGGCAGNLHRPEGLAFGPDGKLYVTAFRLDATDTDKIIIVDAKARTCTNQIVLDQPGDANRAEGQAIVFGPGGDLFVPMLNSQQDNQFTGGVRRYNVTKPGFPFTNFVLPSAQGGALHWPWFLAFGNTDASTLNYGG